MVVYFYILLFFGKILFIKTASVWRLFSKIGAFCYIIILAMSFRVEVYKFCMPFFFINVCIFISLLVCGKNK